MSLPHPTEDQMLIAFAGTRTTALIAPLEVTGHFRVVAIRDLGKNMVEPLIARLPGTTAEEIRVATEDLGRFAREAPSEDLFWLAVHRLAPPEDVKRMMTTLKVEELLGPQMIVVLRNDAIAPERNGSLDLFFNSDEGPVQLNSLHTPIYIGSVDLP